MSLKRFLALLLLVPLCGLSVQAQVTPTPEPTDYAAFPKFISERNIFDPARRPQTSRSVAPKPAPKPRPTAPPTFSLVGTMNYGKGAFAFFDGTGPDYRKTLQHDGEIAGYRVTEILPTGVTLISPDTNQVAMKVGMQMQRDADDKWVLSAQSGPITSAAASEKTISSPSQKSGDTGSGGASAGSANDPNDVLKRLMQLREKEMK
jgi:hypothetical protein